MEMNTNHVYHNQTCVEADPSSKPPPQPPPQTEFKQEYVVNSKKDDYDFSAYRNIRKPTSNVESVAHLVKGCLGGGIMGIHEAYMKCGLWTSLGCTILFGVYISYCIYLLVKSAQILYKRLNIPSMSYPDLAEAALKNGPFPGLRKYCRLFRYSVDMIICMDLFGACCVYQIIIAKTVKTLIEDHIQEESVPLRLYILCVLIPVLLLGMITTLKYLAPFSLLGDFFIGACVVATVYYGLRVAGPIGEVPAFKSPVGFFEFCGVAVFSMEGVGVALPIENNMKNPQQFPRVLIAGYMTVVSFVTSVGFFGYWGFREKASAPVTLNFPSEVFPTILKLLMAVMIFVTFGLNFWAPFNLCWHYLCKRHDPAKFWLWERVYRAMIIMTTCCIAIAFPNIGNLMGLLGAFCLSNIGFIFPALIDLLVIWETPGLGKYKWKLYKDICILIAGFFIFSAGTYANVRGLISKM